MPRATHSTAADAASTHPAVVGVLVQHDEGGRLENVVDGRIVAPQHLHVEGEARGGVHGGAVWSGDGD